MNTYKNGSLRPNDITSSYSQMITHTYTNISDVLQRDDISIEDKAQYINYLTGLYRNENEELGLSFCDKRGRRYINYLCAWPVETVKHSHEGNIIQQSQFMLYHILDHYYGDNSNYNSVDYLPPREVSVLDMIFNSEKSKEILTRNTYGFDKYARYSFKSEEDKKYCEAVLGLVKEITIRSYNYSKYISGPDYEGSTDKDVAELYERLSENCTRDKEYADKGPIGKTLKKIKYRMDLYRRD